MIENMAYWARPNPSGDFSQWWGAGGAELWDTIDPYCCSESGCHQWDDTTVTTGNDRRWVGPIAPADAEVFDEHARAIPGYHKRGLGTATVWRQRGKVDTGETVTL